VDSHRSYSPDEPDGQWYQRERGHPEPEWERRGVDPRYAPQPSDQPYGQAPAYGDYHVPEPRGGYPPDGGGYPSEGGGYPPEGDGRYPAPTDLGDPRAGGRAADSGEPTGRMPSMSPMSPQPGPQHSSGAGLPPVGGYAAPTSGLPHVVPDGPPPMGGPAGDGEPARHATEQIDRAALRRPSGGPGPLGDGVYRSRRPGTVAAIATVTVIFDLLALRLLVAAFFSHPVQVGGSIAAAFVMLGLPMFGLGLYGLLGGGAAAPGAGARVWLRTPLVYLPVALTLFVAAGLAAS
jgi:hypothetical protein